jgi:hypothetical protein
MKIGIGVRLAIRHEGKFVNAYLARSDSMDDAMLLGSLLTTIAMNEPIWLRWKALMSDVLASMVEDIFGQRPDMPEQQAPEHERSGEA